MAAAAAPRFSYTELPSLAQLRQDTEAAAADEIERRFLDGINKARTMDEGEPGVLSVTIRDQDDFTGVLCLFPGVNLFVDKLYALGFRFARVTPCKSRIVVLMHTADEKPPQAWNEKDNLLSAQNRALKQRNLYSTDTYMNGR